VVAVLEVAGHKRWVFIRHVLHSERERGVVKPPFPVAAAVLGRRYWDNILLFAVVRLHVLAPVLGKARHFSCSGRWKVKRVVQDQVQRGTCGHLARAVRKVSAYGLLRLT